MGNLNNFSKQIVGRAVATLAVYPYSGCLREITADSLGSITIVDNIQLTPWLNW